MKGTIIVFVVTALCIFGLIKLAMWRARIYYDQKLKDMNEGNYE